LAGEAASSCGRLACLNLQPADDPAVAKQLAGQTREAVAVFQSGSGYSLAGLPDLSETLEHISSGTCLPAAELNSIAKLMALTRSMSGFLSSLEAKSSPDLRRCREHLRYVGPLFSEIKRAIDESGELKDEASHKLRSLRRQLKDLDARIQNELTAIIRCPDRSKALQELLFTQRNGRYVLPVSSCRAGAIKGIVHDSSASGLTVYIEPIGVVELGNRMRLTQSEIEREEMRILEALSALCRNHKDEISSSFLALVDLDVLAAKVSLGFKYKGSCPELTSDGTLHLRQASHPLLWLQQLKHSHDFTPNVVANDVKLGGQQRTMVITGPNTGGKTVLIKTVGLACLMAKAGLLIPAGEGSRLPLFQQIFADIGDEQSIEQNLSTFSARMSNLVDILDEAGDSCLVLLDEIGAGTDPGEGAALARALLEHLNASGSLTIASTHLGQIKTLAYTEKGFINTSLEFDEETLSPTYRLRTGVPGSSKATSIARRLGLRAEVVERAEELLTGADADLGALVARLETTAADLATKQAEIEREQARARQLARQAEQKLKEAEQEKEEIRGALAARMEEELRKASETIRSTVSNLQRQPDLARAQKAREEIEHLRKQLDWLAATTEPTIAGGIAVGQHVRIKSLNQTGIVEEVSTHAGEKEKTEVLVKAGNLRIRLPLSDLEHLQAGPAAVKAGKQEPAASPQAIQQGSITQKAKSPISSPTQPGSPRLTRHPKPRKIRADEAAHRPMLESQPAFIRTDTNTLDLRGERVDAALPRLEKFLDEAVLKGLNAAMIIHGYGTGALSQAVRQLLSCTSYALDFRPGQPDEGGDGVTIIRFD